MRPAEPVRLPLVVDSNAPTFWRDGRLHLYTSAGEPMLSVFDAQFQLVSTTRVGLDRTEHLPMWIESVWQSDDGALYAWYHYERVGLCPNSKLTAPQIGALVSRDGGRNFRDLGLVANSAEAMDCSASNGYFGGGHGDFSVILDRAGQYFYFLFGSYGGEVSSQGVAIARMSAGNIANPVGAVWKYYQGAWAEPGLGGRVTPIFPASAGWAQPDTDAFWGPSVHWNNYLERYVVVMNRSCCEPGWPQEGVYLTMNADLGDPVGWSAPQRIAEAGDWYPWLMGLGEGETSSEAGQRVRLFVRDLSEWELVFQRPEESAGQAPPTEAPSEETDSTPAPVEPEPVPEPAPEPEPLPEPPTKPDPEPE
jgi:hypothetical protein